MHALLHEARVVDNPSLDPALRLHRRHDELAHLVRRDARRSYHRRDRLHALALARHQQSRVIILQRSRPVHVTEHLSQTLDILDRTRFARSRLAAIDIRQVSAVPATFRYSRFDPDVLSRRRGATLELSAR